ncbi:protein-tyrosine-phosphatase [Cellulomonas sp. HZM]|uniref:arsenate reductase/protein-tyrosine-phosphatase family protein n=1 Tax=Cellulomonas sp. HZM TaxID=1454010 RepID=UPI000493AD68|nr:protein-tyrosine-phosphatase [Cellulomonas sp. HZM]
MPTAQPVRVLAVCTGNVCRSPAIERLLAAGLGATWRGAAPRGLPPAIEVSSAGVGAVVGSPMTLEMQELVASRGGVPGEFAARALTSEMVAASDLVLAATRQHRAAVVELFPAAVRRTFTLRELARLAAGVDPADLPGAGATTADRLTALVRLATMRRGMTPAARPQDDDVVDPYGGDRRTYATSFGQLVPAVETIVAAVRR